MNKVSKRSMYAASRLSIAVLMGIALVGCDEATSQPDRTRAGAIVAHEDQTVLEFDVEGMTCEGCVY